MLVALGFARWNSGLVTNYDLGIFAQSAQDYARGEWPFSEIRGLPLLGDHFSPLLALNGLAWRLWPDPRVLVVVQALLVAAAALVIARGTRPLVGAGPALALAALFLLGRGVMAAALFDFHETAYAAPLVALICLGLTRRRWALVVGASTLLLLVKEDLGLTVMGAAAAWLVGAAQEERRTGASRWHRFGAPRRVWVRAAGLALLGAVGMGVAMFVVARVNPAGGSDYLGVFGLGERRHVTGAQTGGLLDVRRLWPFLTYTLAALVVGWRSPLTLVALPTLLWRAVSSNPLYWAPEFHYDLVPAVVAAFAAAQVLARRTQAGSPVVERGRPAPSRAVTRVAVALAAVGSLALSAQQVHHRLPQGLVWAPNADVRAISRLGTHVPPDAPVAALNDVGAYLVATHSQVHTLQLDHAEPARYAIFSDGDAWADRYPRVLRLRLIALAQKAPGGGVRHDAGFTLVDLGASRAMPGTSRP